MSLVLTITGCAGTPARHDWEHRLRDDAVVLLGELHDNAEHHRLRLDVLRRAFAAGWRPALAMEQFDRERQPDIERARAEKPRDVQHLIALAATPAGTNRGTWQWDFYRPFVALALEYGVPLIAANLSNADVSRVVREGTGAVFDAAGAQALGLSQAVPAGLQAAQEREIDDGHCKALPARLLPAMARGQMARDAVMASILARHASRGVVLIAGNGHVRRDIGVPHWLPAGLRHRTWTVGYLEYGNNAVLDNAFDAVNRTAAAPRADPCIAFAKRMKPP